MYLGSFVIAALWISVCAWPRVHVLYAYVMVSTKHNKILVAGIIRPVLFSPFFFRDSRSLSRRYYYLTETQDVYGVSVAVSQAKLEDGLPSETVSKVHLVDLAGRYGDHGPYLYWW